MRASPGKREREREKEQAEWRCFASVDVFGGRSALMLRSCPWVGVGVLKVVGNAKFGLRSEIETTRGILQRSCVLIIMLILPGEVG